MEHCILILPSMLEIIPRLYQASLNAAVLDLVKQVSESFFFFFTNFPNDLQIFELSIMIKYLKF